MKFDINEINAPIWFSMFPDDPESPRIAVRAIPHKMAKKITQKTETVTREWKENKSGEFKEVISVTVDEDKRMEMNFDAIIFDWKNIEGPDGKPVEVTKENKLLFMTNWPEFAETVFKGVKAISKRSSEVKEEQEKN